MAAAPRFDLTGRTALVTGASSGFGDRFARSLAAAGARVVLAARRTDRLEALCAEIQRTGGQAMTVAMDVTDEASTMAAYDTVEAVFGRVDTIIANAGTAAEGPALDLDAADFDQVVAVNLRGVFLTVREGARRLIATGARERQDGRIVIVSSAAATAVLPGLAAYASTKAAVLQMGKVMAREWVRQGINVNMLLPGYVETEINRDWFASEAGQRQIGGFPRRRLMDIGELDTMLLYLACDASRSVTGSAFTIDDGQTL